MLAVTRMDGRSAVPRGFNGINVRCGDDAILALDAFGAVYAELEREVGVWRAVELATKGCVGCYGKGC